MTAESVWLDEPDQSTPPAAITNQGALEEAVSSDEPLTELGIARRMVRVYGSRLRYVPTWRTWFAYDGTRWLRDDTGESARCAKTIARALHLAGLARDDDRGKKMIGAAIRAESARGVTSTLALAGTEPGIAVRPDDFDADPQLLNVANGVLDLRTLELRPHDHTLLLSKITRAAYYPDMTTSTFSTFLERVQPDAAMRDFLARLFGHALSGTVVEHLLPVLYGVGGNGKSTLVETVLAALGDYAITSDPGLLIDRGRDAHPTGIADLFGRRLAVTHETDAGRRLAEGTVKRLTGGDRIKARRMREDFWEFDPSHTVVMVTNHRPIVGGDDEGIWRRIRLVPFDEVIPVEERDPDLKAKLTAEIDGVLSWLVTGYADWRQHGLEEPQRVVTATAAYRADSDHLGRFLDDRCVRHDGAQVQSSQLYTVWRNWAASEGIDLTTPGATGGTQKAFTEALINRGFDPPGRTRVGMVWTRIGLLTDREERP